MRRLPGIPLKYRGRMAAWHMYLFRQLIWYLFVKIRYDAEMCSVFPTGLVGLPPTPQYVLRYMCADLFQDVIAPGTAIRGPFQKQA